MKQRSKRTRSTSPDRSKKPSVAKKQTRQKKAKKVPYIGDYDDENLDDFIRDNEYLRTGYRIFFHTYDVCAKSLFMMHNETVNVWSHLIGSLIFIGMIFYVLVFLSPTSLHGDSVGLA